MSTFSLGRIAAQLEHLPAKLALRRRLPDLLGLLAAALYGLPSVTYAFGRDQAIFYYMGREWLHGSLPYRDAFDLKPPAIYLLHGISIALFGPHIHAIRVVELAGVLTIGWLAALAVERDTPRARGEVGLCALLAVSWYYTISDFWESGQVEIWEGIFLLAAYVVMRRDQRLLRAAFLAGVLAAIAIMFKFTAGIVALLLVVPQVARALDAPTLARKLRGRRAVLALLSYAAGGVSVVALVLAYFAAHSALPWLVELGQYIRFYAKNAWNPPNPWEAVVFYWTRSGLWAVAFVSAWAIGSAEALARRAWRVLAGALFAMLLLLGALATVAVQRKFFPYHWGVVAPFLVLTAAYGLAECAKVRPIAAYIAVTGLLVAGFVLAPTWLTNPAVTYRTYVLDHFWPYLRKRIDHDALMSVFVGGQNYNWSTQMAIAKTINERKRPGDLLHVRGFELGIYALTHLRSPSRFISEIPLDDPAVSFNHEAWMKEHNRALWRARPRFFVGFVDRLEDNDRIRGHGYHELQRSGLFLLWERDEPTKTN